MKIYWVELIKNFRLKFGYNRRLNGDLLRLEYSTVQFTKANEFSEFAQLLLQAGCPAESLKVIERGFKLGALGTGAEAEKHNHLRLLVQKKLAEMDITLEDRSLVAEKNKDGAALSNLGYGYVTAGKYEEGIKKILDVLKIEGIKFEDDAKLHLGLAYLAAGQKSNAIRTFKTVKGKDGTADLARYWVLVSNSIVK